MTKVVTYVQCDYWVNPKIAQYLTKGTLVELQNRVCVNAYKKMDGEAKTSLTFHVNTIKLHGNGKQQKGNAAKGLSIAPVDIKESVNDLPF